MEYLDATYYDNSIRQWLIALAAVLLVTIGLGIVRHWVMARFGKLAARTGTTWDDLLIDFLRRTKGLFLLIVGLYAGTLFLALDERVRGLSRGVLFIAVIIQAGLWASTAIRFRLEDYRKRRLKDDPSGVMTMAAIGFIAQIVLWVIVLLLVLDNAGVEVTPLIASLGVGGIAVALAVQNILGDLFASLSIVLDKPFVIGDFLIINDFLGSVEYIGLKTTRLRSLSGEQIVFSNADLLSSRIRNYGRMFERRVVFSVGVTYGTPKEKLERIPRIIRELVEAQPKTRFDRSHFKEYGDSSLNFETVYYVLAPEYNTYMDIQQAINLGIYERFGAEGLDFAFPTRTLHIVQEETEEAGELAAPRPELPASAFRAPRP
ncbi:MAG TPA: mechanosensitive ion channel family protein [Planctomycetota bacterium]|nr:mechanosensitive ion channel family protein [Planctomycetota bacterium]